MISAASRRVLVASVPLLRAHGRTVSTTFCQSLCADLPELRTVFNMGYMADGAGHHALASALFMYAAKSSAPRVLGPALQRIAHQHASVGIRAGHYAIVGRHLLAAIVQALGRAATPQLLAAWGEAYNAMAYQLIGAAKTLYAEAGIRPGQTRAMRVTGVERQSADVVSLCMAPDDGAPLPWFKPGQYVSVTLVPPSGARRIGQFSLSDAPEHGSMRISVRRANADTPAVAGAVSDWIHDDVAAGSVLQVSPPFGAFSVDTESTLPLLLLSAEMGIAPLIAALNRIAQVNPSRRVIFAHAARDPAHHAHLADIASAKAVMPQLQVATFYENGDGAPHALQGRMDMARLPNWPRCETSVVVCGPLQFVQEQSLALQDAGVPAACLQCEVCGPDAPDCRR